MKKVVQSEFKLGLTFMITDLVCQIQMICLRETKVIELKSNA